MAFYGDYGKKQSRDQKRKTAEMRGGFEDEGTRYTGRPAQHGKPVRGGRPQGEGRTPYGERSPYGDRSPRGARPGARPYEGQHSDARPGRSFGTPSRGYAPKPFEGRNGNSSPSKPYGARKSAPRKGETEYRFARDAGQRYSERGAGTSPRPYGEQREARQQQYAPRPINRPQGNSAEDYRYNAPAAYDNAANGSMDAVPPENLLSGRNPIREALKSGRDIEKLLVARGELSGSARELVQMAKEKHIPVQEVDRVRLDAITHNHQGMLAFASAHEYHTVQDMLDLAQSRKEDPFLVILDGITDPHNLGAIIRTAECAGAHGVIVQERRAVGLTPAAVKASAGAVEYLPVARVTNLTTVLMDLKAQNIWAYAADMKGEDFRKVDFSGPMALVIGAEGEGVSRRVLDTCDKRVSLPIRGQIDSLNASVAAGVLLYAAASTR